MDENTRLRAPETFRSALQRIHDTQHVSWLELAHRLSCAGFDIPAGSLGTFAKTGYLAPKYKGVLLGPRKWTRLDEIPQDELLWMLSNRQDIV